MSKAIGTLQSDKKTTATATDRYDAFVLYMVGILT